MTNVILSHFPKHLIPRPGQVQALKQIQTAWNDSDVIVIQLPTAFGKSAIAKTIMDWQGRAAYITPTNLLVQQFQESYGTVPVIYNKELYECNEPGYSYCEDRAASYNKCKQKYCNDCPYVKDNKRIMNRYRTKSNSTAYMYIARKLYQPVLIADEAHTLINLLSDFHAVKISHKRFKYPISKGYISRKELEIWVSSLKNIDNIITDPKRYEKGLKILYNEIINNENRYLIKEERTNDDRYLKLVPMDLRGLWPVLWPTDKVNKIILMSATINKKDIESLGLAGRRVTYINADSPIPAENRPFKLINHIIGALNKDNINLKAKDIANLIKDIIDAHPNEKGLIHCTYQIAEILKKMTIDDRLMFHDKFNKAEQFQKFKDSGEGDGPAPVLVASGMYEGVDLPYDAGRFQVIVKTPWPSLAEPAIRYKMQLDNAWYEWSALKDMLQAYGRICRSETDYGITYCIDESFKRLLNNKDIPKWFLDAYSEI